MKKLVVFDVDGTLVDSEPLHKISRDIMLNRLGIYSEQLSDSAIGVGKRDFWERVQKEYGLSLDCNALTVEEFDILISVIRERGVKLSTGVKELLEFLKTSGVKMAVASSSDGTYVDEILKATGIKDYFNVVCTGDLVKHTKPDPEIYLKTMDFSNEVAKDTLAVEDSTLGILAAVNAKITCIGFNANDMGAQQDFSPCEQVVSDMRDIVKFV
ncbi:MAG: HAD-IA family hydrolase [Clostridia bacterium]|nr:HAD-IA family hydrolase [Clostridia bacterium]